MTPSVIWQAVPMRYRIITLLAGFMMVYYCVFGKHHHFDQEASSIHSEVEALIKDANNKGFMQQNLSEAELPEIFRDNPRAQAPVPTPTPAPTPTLSTEGKEAGILPLKKKEAKKSQAQEESAKPENAESSEGTSGGKKG